MENYNMNFRTKVGFEKLSDDWKITFNDTLLLLGSCFSDSVGQQMQNVALNAVLNPFGTLYNPCSIAAAINRLMDGNEFLEEEIFEYEGLYHSFMHHSRFSNISVKGILQEINSSFFQAREQLKSARFLIVTFGTSWVYRLLKNGNIVANCHKLPEKNFIRNRLSVNEIVDVFDNVFFRLRKYNPNLRVIFTVSPIRHFRDGAHGNQLSKSTLLLAIDELCSKHTNTCYFPAYEIILDELRDYRFFAEDMVHPSSVAVQYVWKCFIEMFFDDKTRSYFPRIEKVKKAFLHKPFNNQTKMYEKFMQNINLQKEALEIELGIKIS